MDVPTRQPAALVLAEVVQAKAARAVTRRCGTHKRQRVRLLACQSRHAHTESRAPPLNCCNLLSKCNVLLSEETDNAPLVLHGCAQQCHVRIREGSFEHSPPMQMWTRTVRKRAGKVVRGARFYSPHSSVFCARVLNVKVSFWSGPSREVSDSGNSQRGHLPPLQTPYSCGRQQAPILGKAKVGACTGVLIEPGDVRDIVAIRTI